MNLPDYSFDSSGTPWLSALGLLLLAVQLPMVAVLLSRLLEGPGRLPPLKPNSQAAVPAGAVSAVVPTLNEVARLSPCLTGLGQQGEALREIIVVDSRSTDGTVDLVARFQTDEPRLRLVTDPPLPQGWIGRPWALHNGFLETSPQSTWVLGLDADTQPQPHLVDTLIHAVEDQGYDMVSLSPQFILKGPGEFWLQPALLLTLVYRFGPSGSRTDDASRVMANGQCFLTRRSLLEQLGGYESARRSFCDDVTLARRAAEAGARVGFWDGANLLKVRMYDGVAELWREWGRSLDLKDAATPQQTWGDVGFLAAVQGLPLLLLLLFGAAWLGGIQTPVCAAVLGLNGALLAARVALLWAIAPSYDRHQAQGQWAFWLSPLADPLAALRIALSASRTPTQWRSRQYDGYDAAP
ncbi:MAG: 2'-O-glycosyltransferase CruG [Cyanobacteria bacterium P01_A01_bin.135]